MSRSKSAPATVWAVYLMVAVAVWVRGEPVEADETLAERRARIRSMDAAEKEKLRKAQERFEALDRVERERLRELNKIIQAHPDCGELLAVMEEYCEWVNTLSVYERDALRELEPAEKIQKIKELQEDQASRRRAWSGGRSRFGGERLQKLASEEEAVLGRWIDEFAAANLPKLLEALPEPRQRELLEELKQAKNDPESRRKLFARLWMRWQLASPGKPIPVDEAAWEQLHSRLSPKTRAWVDELHPNARRFRVRSLIGAFVFLNSQEELSEHLQNKLTPEQRDRLTTLPPDEMRQELWRYYVRSKWPDALPHRRPGRWGGGLFGRPPGPPRSPGSEPGGPSRRMPMKGPRDRTPKGPPKPPPE